HQELTLRAREVARQREAAPPLAEQLAHERQRRAREEAAADRDVVAVLHARDRVLEGRQLRARRLRLRLDPPAGGDEVVLARVQVSTSQRAWWRSSSRRVRSSIGCSRSGTSTCFDSPQSAVVK